MGHVLERVLDAPPQPLELERAQLVDTRLLDVLELVVGAHHAPTIRPVNRRDLPRKNAICAPLWWATAMSDTPFRARRRRSLTTAVSTSPTLPGATGSTDAPYATITR